MENSNKESQLDKMIDFWNEREENLKKKFKNPELDKEDFFIKEKLKYFEGISKQSKNLLEGDGITRNTLNGTIRKIEKQLYPNWVRRQFERLIKRPLERAIKDFIDQRRIVPQSNTTKWSSPLHQKIHDNDWKTPDDGGKQNLKNNTTQEIKQKEQQGQRINAEPPKNSISERNNISQEPLRNTKVEGTKNVVSKIKDVNLPKKQIKHRLR